MFLQENLSVKNEQFSFSINSSHDLFIVTRIKLIYLFQVSYR